VRKSHTVAENILSLYVVQAVSYVLPLLVFPYLVRVLGLELFGTVVLVQAIMNYFIILTDYGFNLSATRRVSLCRDDPSELRQVFASVVFVKFCLALLSAAILFLAGFFVEFVCVQWRLFLMAFVAVIGHVIFPTWYLQGTERMRLMSQLSLVGSLVVTTLIFVLVKTPDDYVLVALLQSLVLVIPGLLCFVILPKQGVSYFVLPPLRYMRQVMAEGWHVFVSTAAVTLYTSSNIVVLGAFSSPLAVGYFGVADKVIKAGHGLISPISQAIYPHVSSLLKHSPDRGFAFLRHVFFKVGLLSFCLSMAIFLFSEAIVRLAVGTSQYEVVLLVKMMAFIPFIVALSNLFGVQTMLNLGMSREFSRVILFSGFLNVIVLIPAVLMSGERGAAISSLATEAFVTCSMMAILYKNGTLKKILPIPW